MILRHCVLTDSSLVLSRSLFRDQRFREDNGFVKMSDSARSTIFGDEIHDFATMSLTLHFSKIPGR